MLETVEETGTAGEGVQCELCGSSDFVCEGGFFFCQICQTQSQDVREVIEADDFGLGQTTHTGRAQTYRGGKAGNKTKKEARERILPFEGYNCYLKVVTDRLISLGFPKTLRYKVFNLWSSFLVKRNAIFVDGPNPAGPKSASQWLHTKRRRLTKNRGKKHSDPVDEDDGLVSIAVKKRRRTLAKKKAMEKTYSSQLAEVMDLAPEASTSTNDKASSVKKPAPKFTKHSKKVIWAIHREGLSTKGCIPRPLLQPEIFTLKSALALIFIALREIGCKVCMTDVLRLVWSGTIYMPSLQLVFPKKADDDDDTTPERKISPAIDNIFSDAVYNYLSTHYYDNITNLLLYLNIEDFNRPTFHELLPKFIDELALPREFECLILQMEKVLPTTTSKFLDSRASLRPYRLLPEFHILSVILVLLRLLFGLDDVTEVYQSDFATKVNSIITPSNQSESREESIPEYSKLFVIEDWFSYLRQRTRIVEGELFNPLLAVGSNSKNPTSASIHHYINNYTEFKGIQSSRRKAIASQAETLHLFQRYSTSLSLPFVPPPPPISASTCFSEQQIFQDFKKNHPLAVLNPENSIPPQDADSFTKSRIDFVTQPNKYISLLKHHGHNVTLIHGDAQQFYPNPPVPPEKNNEVPLFQPFAQFDAHLPKFFAQPASLKFLLDLCSRILIGAYNTECCVQEKMHNIMEELQYYYSCHLRPGVVHIFPYDKSDEDAAAVDTDSD